MGTPAKLRIIFEDDDIRKLVLPSGIPSTLQDLVCVIQETFHIPGEFTVMYQDMDFGGQFLTLSCIDEVEDKGTLRIVKTQPVLLTLSSVEGSDIDSPLPEQSPNSSLHSGHSSTSQDTILLSSDESGTSSWSQPWPAKFQIPTFSYDVDLLLEAGNQAFQKDGTLLNNPRQTSSILEKLAEAIFCYTAYPTGIQVLAVVEALVQKYPCLKKPGSFNGLYGWQQRMKYKMGNCRAKLRGCQLACPELEVNSLKRQKSDEMGLPKGIKRPKKAEVNFLPPLPFGETEATLEKEREHLLMEIKKKNNEKIIREKMERFFPYRRLEVVKHCPAVQNFMERWPALFCESQIKEEFRRITTILLEQTFLSKLDFYTPKLLEIFGTKGGVAGTKMRPMLNSLSQQHVESRRDAIIRCLMEYLGESGEELIKDYQDVSREAIKEEYAGHVMKIFVLRESSAEEDHTPADVSIIIEGTEVLDDCRYVAKACLLLMGFVYAMNLSYPPKMKYRFKVFQKLFLELDVLKISPKVQSLRNKLLR
ncbi:uncharacterized protein LOC114555819 [Perca flavescens]|uniref:uncharacterized protein LOC114555819 n=1 Tax=Perca flavescens TaxID=8167 RepID=UPI00106E3AF7|nr:uncharacterized protein LOC114555819 [Perca flavescens]